MSDIDTGEMRKWAIDSDMVSAAAYIEIDALCDALDAARARIKESETPDQWWDRDNPEYGVEDARNDIIDNGNTGVFHYSCARSLPDQWFRAVERFIPDDGSRNAGEASHIEVLGPFATRAEAEAAK